MATIYCFSSTGNSLYTAKRIAAETGAVVLPMNEDNVVCDDDVIGFVCPDYFWGLPRIVTRFIVTLQINRKDAYVFAVVTCGGSGPGVSGLIKKLLLEKGVRLSYGGFLATVTNYVPEYTVNDSEARRLKTEAALERMIESIKNRESNRVSSFTAINSLVNKFCPGENSDRYFSVSPKCTGCGTCQKICPVDNIVMENGRPQFLHHCEHCLGCLHNCPAVAIDWKRKTQGKKRYRHPEISLDDLVALAGRQV